MNKIQDRSEKIGNSKQSSQARWWSFTLNNWTEPEYDDLLVMLRDHLYVVGKEVGASGTPHLQGHVEFKAKVRLSAVKKMIPRAHWEITRNKDASRVYCQKDGEYVTNIRVPRKIAFPEMNRTWQREILAKILETPDDRTIHWYWEATGNSGKTTFVKYLKIYKDAVECPSKSNDAFHRIAKLFEDKVPINIVVFDIPRVAMEYINYGSIEKIKNGNVCSGKYEGCDCVFACPHVFVFANEPPNMSKLSIDRWNIKEIKTEPCQQAPTSEQYSRSSQDTSP